jgi:pyruvate,water dikinase
MENAKRRESLLGFSFIQSSCTSVGVNVFQMVRHLDSLAPGKYSTLFGRFESIQGLIREILASRPKLSAGPMTVPIELIDRSSAPRVGSKMANLGEAAKYLNLTVPDGFAISSAAFEAFMSHSDLRTEIDRLTQAMDPRQIDEFYDLSARIQQLIVAAPVPEPLQRAVDSAVAKVIASQGPNMTFAVRSSALGEDGPHVSFAGQYRSLLNVRPESMLDAYKEVVASAYSPQAMHYRLLHGIRDDEFVMCVGCLVMVEAKSGGVVYTANPLDSMDNSIRISSTWGLPKAVVDGVFSLDEFVVDRESPASVLTRRVADKPTSYVSDPVEGVSRAQATDQNRQAASLDDNEVKAVADIANRLEQHFSSPQDIEFAVTGGAEIVVLQCRALRQVSASESLAHETPAGEVLFTGGVGVSPGLACGVANWVIRDGDVLQFPQDGILALAEPLPRWAFLIDKAAAVVAKGGSMAGHLATVARELEIPALFGVGNRVELLSNGMEVTVDADTKSVFRGLIEGARPQHGRARSLPRESPIHQLLDRVVAHMSPLNLKDPDAPDFTPGSCRTFHDITRFCHEKAVHEVFSFGRTQRFPKHSAKQLHFKVPMQWWILDLDDGLDAQARGKYVRLENIQCVPMLSLWDGMVAIPWEGPPAVSGKGLASVLFEATTNPDLATPFKRRYANRNYFLISRNFMNLQSRFGFHLCQVEALVSERKEENYLSFTFKGGAANIERRVGRVKLLGELLEAHGFEVRRAEDTAAARLSGLGQDIMKDKLRLIGYLLMHTRQLDMIMSDPSAVAHYRSKIEEDLKAVLQDDSHRFDRF